MKVACNRVYNEVILKRIGNTQDIVKGLIWRGVNINYINFYKKIKMCKTKEVFEFIN